MTATEKRRRRWVWTATVLGGLTVGSGVCGVQRAAHAQAAKDPVPVVILPSSYVEPPPLPKVQLPNPRLRVEAPEVLPLPLPVLEKAPAPKPKFIPEAKPIENPMPVAPPLLPKPPAPPEPSGFPILPPLTQPLQPAQPANPAKAPPIPPPVLHLQPFEPGNNVKSSEPLPPPAEKLPPAGTLTSLPHTQSPPGDAPMPLSLRRTALSAALGTALVAGTMYADNDPPKTEMVAKKDLEATNQLIADLKKDLAELKTKDLVDLKQQLTSLKAKDLSDLQKEVDAVKLKSLADLKKELDTFKEFKKKTENALDGTADKGNDGLVKKIAALDDKLATLTKQLDALDKKLETTRTALSSPVGKEPAKEKPKLGTVKIVNLYPTDVDVLVNGKGYRVAPNETKTLALTVGTFTYQLLTGGGEETSRGLKDGEEVTLVVNR